jgi:hypothetical protein
VRLVHVLDLRAERRDVLVGQGARLVQERRQLLARGLALLRADAEEVAPVGRAVGASLPLDVERDDAQPRVERDDVDEGEERGVDVRAADADEFVAHGVGIVHALDTQVVVDAEDDDAAAGVGERDDALRDALGVRELDLEFEEGVFAAADERHQLRPRGLRRRRGQVVLERAQRGGLMTLLVSEFSASHLCKGGALLSPARTHARAASLGYEGVSGEQ